MPLGATLTFHRTLIINLKATEGSAFTLVLDALLSQLVVVSDNI